MKKQIFIFVIFAMVFQLPGCDNKSDDKSIQSNEKDMRITTETLKQILEAFNRHDLDGIMEYFAEDCSFDFPRGPEPWGQRFIGKAQVREALASRFKGIPDVHYGDDSHWVSEDGSAGLSDWILTGTTAAGVPIRMRGCDLWQFKDGKVIRKDSYWKIIEQSGLPREK